MDLIGLSNDRRFVVVELKKAGGQHPLYAAAELVRYSAELQRNKDKLGFHSDVKCHDRLKSCNIFDLSTFEEGAAMLIVAGPNAYWKEFGELREILEDVRKCLSEDTGLDLHFAEFSNEDFRAQRGAAEKYRPQLLSTDATVWRSAN